MDLDHLLTLKLNNLNFDLETLEYIKLYWEKSDDNTRRHLLSTFSRIEKLDYNMQRSLGKFFFYGATIYEERWPYIFNYIVKTANYNIYTLMQLSYIRYPEEVSEELQKIEKYIIELKDGNYHNIDLSRPFGNKVAKKLLKTTFALDYAIKNDIIFENTGELRTTYHNIVQATLEYLSEKGVFLEYHTLENIIHWLRIDEKFTLEQILDIEESVIPEAEIALKGDYIIHVEPSNKILQMKSLVAIPTCFSPGRERFEYGKLVLEHPHAAYVVITKGGTIVGRFTLLYGYDVHGKDSVAVGSKLYLKRKIFSGTISSQLSYVLERYAQAFGLRLLKEGILEIPNWSEQYLDDCAQCIKCSIASSEFEISKNEDIFF